MIGEILGFIGTIVVLISFIPKDVKYIRSINIIGCVVWIASAIYNKSWSVFTLNSVLMIVHITHLIKLYNETRIKRDKRLYVADKNGKYCERRQTEYPAHP